MITGSPLIPTVSDVGSVRLQVGHTSAFEPEVLDSARALLGVVFDGELTEHDWEHGLGGIHTMAWVGDRIVGHASVIQRRLLVEGTAWRTGYVEGVGVHPDLQRRGIGGLMMEPLEAVIHRSYDLGALGATDEAMAFYGGRGWRRWQGPTAALTPAGIVRTPDEDDCIHVLPVARPVDLGGVLTCDWREGDVW